MQNDLEHRKEQTLESVSLVKISRRCDFPGFLTTAEESTFCQHSDKKPV